MHKKCINDFLTYGSFFADFLKWHKNIPGSVFIIILYIRFTFWLKMACNMSKKRKVDNESRVFKPSWTEHFLVIEHQGRILCLICQEMLAVCKEYNIKRHYSTKHESKFKELAGQFWIDRINSLKQNILGQQSFFKVVQRECLFIYIFLFSSLS